MSRPRPKHETGAALCQAIVHLVGYDPNIRTIDAARLIAEDLLPAEIWWYGERMGFDSHAHNEMTRLHNDLCQELTPVVDMDTKQIEGIAYAMSLHYHHFPQNAPRYAHDR